MKEEKAKRNTRGEGKSSNLCLRYLKQQHRRPELLFISHVLSQVSKAPSPPRHVTLLSHPTSPSSLASSPPACRTNIVLQAGGWEGESNPPPFSFLGQACSGPTLMAGSGPAQTKEIKRIVGPRLAQPFWAESSLVSWPAQPT